MQFNVFHASTQFDSIGTWIEKSSYVFDDPDDEWEKFEKWLADPSNASSVGLANERMDVICGMFIALGIFELPTEFESSDPLISYLSYKAYHFPTDDVFINLEDFYAFRWNYLFKRSVANHGAPTPAEDSAFKHVLTYACALNNLETYQLSPIDVWASADKFRDVLTASLYALNPAYGTSFRRQPKSWDVIFTGHVRDSLFKVCANMISQLNAFKEKKPKARYSDIEFQVPVDLASSLQKTNEIPVHGPYLQAGFDEYSAMIRNDIALGRLKGFLLLRAEKRFLAFKLAMYTLMGCYSANMEYMEASLADNAFFLTAQPRKSLKDLHQAYVLAYMIEHVFILPGERARFTSIPDCSSVSFYFKNSSKLGEIEKIFAGRLASAKIFYKKSINAFQVAMAQEVEQHLKRVWRIYEHPFPSNLEETISQTIWDNKDKLPDRFPFLDSQQLRVLIHPIDFVIYFNKKQGSIAVIQPPVHGQATIATHSDLLEIHSNLKFLAFTASFVTKHQAETNAALVELTRYLRTHESRLLPENSTTPKRKDLCTNKVKDNKDFSDYLYRRISLYQGVNRRQPSEFSETLTETLEGFEFVFFDEFDDLNVILDAFRKDREIIIKNIPRGCTDTDEFVAFIKNLPTTTTDRSTQQFNHRAADWDVYMPYLERARLLDPAGYLRLHELNENTGAWIAECENFRVECSRMSQVVLFQYPTRNAEIRHDTPFLIDGIRVVLPDNMLRIDDAYFFGRAWLMMQHQSYDESFGCIHKVTVPPDWMIAPQKFGITPRMPGVFTQQYFITLPFFMQPSPTVQRIRYLVAEQGQLKMETTLSNEGLSIKLPTPNTATGREQHEPWFFDVGMLSGPKRDFENMGTDDHSMCRQKLYSSGTWCSPLQSSASGLDYFQAHGYFVPFGSPFPFMQPEILTFNISFADHHIRNFIGPLFLSHVDPNYTYDAPCQTGEASIKYLQEHPFVAGAIEYSPYTITFMNSTANELAPFFIRKYERMTIVNKNKPYAMRISGRRATLHGGRALHEQMVQIPSPHRSLVFHITHTTPVTVRNTNADDIVRAIGASPDLCAEYSIYLNRKSGECGKYENLDIERTVDFSLATYVMVKHLLQVMDSLSIRTSLRDWVEYRPLICPVNSAETLIQFPFIVMSDDNLKLLSMFMEFMPPVPQTHITMVDPEDALLCESVYPIRISDSPFMFVAESYHHGKMFNFSYDVFKRSRKEQDVFYRSLRGASLSNMEIRDFTEDRDILNKQCSIHTCAILLNSSSNFFTSEKTEHIDTLNWDTCLQNLSSSMETSALIDGLKFSCPDTPQQDCSRLPCGKCKISSIKDVLKCKEQIVHLVGLIGTENMNAMIYQSTLKALLHSGFTDTEIFDISVKMIDRSNNGETPVSLEDSMACCDSTMTAHLKNCILYDYVTALTIAFYAKKFSPDKYQNWLMNMAELYYSSVVDKYNDLSSVFCELVYLNMMVDYAAFNMSGTVEFAKYQRCGWDIENHSSHTDKQVSASTEITQVIQDFMLPFIDRKTKAADEELAPLDPRDAANRGTINRLKRLTKKLANGNSALSSIAGFRNIIARIKDLLLESSDKLDRIRCLWRCNNYIIWAQRKNRKAVTIDAFPETHLSKSCNLDLCEDISPDDPDMIGLMDFLRKLFRNPNLDECTYEDELLDYALDVFSRVFDGEPDEKEGHVFKGPGNNGKTRLQDLLKNTMGGYFVIGDSSLVLLSEKTAGSATSHYTKIKGARLVIISETGQNAVLCGRSVKQLFSPEDLDYRELFREARTFQITMRFIIMTNHWTYMEGGGYVAWTRMVYDPMNSHFVRESDAPKDEAKQWESRTFPQDKNMDIKTSKVFPRCFLALLKSRYGKRPVISERSMETKHLTERFLKETELVTMFVDTMTEALDMTPETQDAPPFVQIPTAYKAYVDFVALKSKGLARRREPQPCADFVQTLISIGKQVCDDGNGKQALLFVRLLNNVNDGDTFHHINQTEVNALWQRNRLILGI
jgi:hypothetical protein